MMPIDEKRLAEIEADIDSTDNTCWLATSDLVTMIRVSKELVATVRALEAENAELYTHIEVFQKSGRLPWVKNEPGVKPERPNEWVAIYGTLGLCRCANWNGVNWQCNECCHGHDDVLVSHWLRISPPATGAGAG